MRTERFFKNPDLPFVELRYSQASKAALRTAGGLMIIAGVGLALARRGN